MVWLLFHWTSTIFADRMGCQIVGNCLGEDGVIHRNCTDLDLSVIIVEQKICLIDSQRANDSLFALLYHCFLFKKGQKNQKMERGEKILKERKIYVIILSLLY
ncbi:hypothetical protein EI42_04075 [Thermosporothrix hazakensis]|uniref:Uncharacterized protein n=1 Tax=Thermosporothrix hazakensis TaxID=644383 RepID=A0A326U6I3_THEHA|nr:hypothetical protein EI42_04075 [Thermosporothrix hazakensis]